jgi:hypothetical protein
MDEPVEAADEPEPELEPGLEPEAAEPPAEEMKARGWFFVLLFLAGIGLLLYRVYPAHHPLAAHPNFIDEIFANNLVLFAARLTLLSAAGVLAVAAVFIVISFWKRGKAGHWMSRFGPFETQAVEDLAGQVDQWIAWWREENERGDELQKQLEENEKMLSDLFEAFQLAQEQLATFTGEETEGDEDGNSV